jgi:hypothetical protein
VVPVWMTNNGLCSDTHEVSYAELAATLREMAEGADLMQDLKTFAAATKQETDSA